MNKRNNNIKSIEIENDIEDINDIIDSDIDDTEIEVDTNITEEETFVPKFVSKHKQSGTHSLEHDIYFKGKIEILEDGEDTSTTYHNDNFEYEPGTMYYHETINNHDYIRESELKKKIYDILAEKTSIDFSSSRRKPSMIDFNNYFQIVYDGLERDKYSNVEIFNELAYYFSESIFNMLKLLEPKWRMKIFKELNDYVGDIPDSAMELLPKNLKIGTEIEFKFYDEDSQSVKLITGVVTEQNHQNRLYIINSYEKVYEVHIDAMTKIMNPARSKYNLKILDNIDFL